MRIPVESLSKRQSNPNPDNGISRTQTISLIVVASSLFVVLLVTYILLRYFKVVGTPNSYNPFKSRKNRKDSKKNYGQVSSRDRGASLSENTSYNPTTTAAVETEERAANAAVAAGVDRNTSVRSVMTLPPYSVQPKETEQILGREGERAGMDTVVEFPETNTEEESRREDQMESLYQIRLQRRNEIAERERHRQERRDARARGDWARLEELRIESQQRANAANEALLAGSRENLSAAQMLAEHQSRGRDRRVSSVSYAQLGHVRHDGTRLRANSNDSERGGLLDGAAPMGSELYHQRNTSDASSLFTMPVPIPHGRGRSTSSALSISTTASDHDRYNDRVTPPSTRDGRSQAGVGSDRPTTGNSGTTTESSPTTRRLTPEESSGSDHAEGQASEPGSAATLPPNYDHLDWGEAPGYTPPVMGRAPSNAVRAPTRQEQEAQSSSIPTRTDTQSSQRSQRPAAERVRTNPPMLAPVTTLPEINIEEASPATTPHLR